MSMGSDMKSACTQVPQLLWRKELLRARKCVEATSSEQQMLLWVSLLIVGMEEDRQMKHVGVKTKQARVEG